MNQTSPLIRIEHLMKRYSRTRFPKSHESREAQQSLLAVDDVTLSIAAGTTLALVGESGSGKSTLALCLACLERPTSGSIWFADRDIAALSEREQRAVRPQLQLVFQDPSSSINPRWTALEILAEPLVVHRRLATQERNERALDLMRRVGLSADSANRRAAEFSGGQKQRLAIARALALEPRVLLLDEVLSALDCSVQAHIANLLLELQASLDLTYIFITHDLTMAAHLADEIAVIHQGRIVEQGAARNVLRLPQHQVTRDLVVSTPSFPAPAGLAQDR